MAGQRGGDLPGLVAALTPIPRHFHLQPHRLQPDGHHSHLPFSLPVAHELLALTVWTTLRIPFGSDGKPNGPLLVFGADVAIGLRNPERVIEQTLRHEPISPQRPEPCNPPTPWGNPLRNATQRRQGGGGGAGSGAEPQPSFRNAFKPRPKQTFRDDPILFQVFVVVIDKIGVLWESRLTLVRV